MRPAVAGQRCIREASMGNEVGGPRPHIAGSCPSPALRIPAVPFKANADRRHHIPKQRHRVMNWPEYDAALRQRGSLTVWFTEAAIAGFFDASSGFEQAPQWRCDEVDDGGERRDVAVAAGTCPGGLEETIEAFEAGVAVGRRPALQDPLAMGLDGCECPANRIENRIRIEQFAGVAQEVGDPPTCGLN